MGNPTLKRSSDEHDAVERLQMALNDAGHSLAVDGLFGPGVESAVKAFQAAQGLDADGIVGPATWGALAKISRHAEAPKIDVSDTLPGFRGDVLWIHHWEGHAGKAYWPRGASGVTLDPGLDLGHAKAELIAEVYKSRLSAEQFAAVEKVLGIRGDAAREALEADPVLRSIRVTRTTAGEVFPHVARPYWQQLCERFPGLDAAQTPGEAHTAMLSLGYNRGAGNRHLEELKEPIAEGDWAGLGERLRAMQQDHQLEGIRKRRRAEGDLILSAVAG